MAAAATCQTGYKKARHELSPPVRRMDHRAVQCKKSINWQQENSISSALQTKIPQYLPDKMYIQR